MKRIWNVHAWLASLSAAEGVLERSPTAPLQRWPDRFGGR